jgi:hypothetical protein
MLVSVIWGWQGQFWHLDGWLRVEATPVALKGLQFKTNGIYGNYVF